MKRLLFYLMLLSGLGFAASSAWLISDAWVSITIKKFEMESLPVFIFATGIYGLFSNLHYGKAKYKKRMYHYYKDYWIPEDSQTPIRIKKL